MKKILIIHGPNLNLLGVREPEVYGSMTLGELNDRIREAAGKAGVEIDEREVLAPRTTARVIGKVLVQLQRYLDVLTREQLLSNATQRRG